jgi:hypothetical protein
LKRACFRQLSDKFSRNIITLFCLAS